MKFNVKILLGLLLFSIVLSSCNNDQVTYAEQLKAEKELIADYISRNNIEVVTTMPTVYPWPDNVYYKSSTGMYIRITALGDSAAGEIASGDFIIARYIQYTLDTTPDSISNWNTIDYPYPTTFTYLNTAQVCAAWHEAVGYMKYMDAEAKLIVPSKLNFSSYADDVIPLGFDLKIKFQKD